MSIKKSKDNEAWMRHYDSQLWIVTSIMIAAIGGLLFWLLGNERYFLKGSIAGYALTIAAVYFYASFRDLYETVNREKLDINNGRMWYFSFQREIYLSIFVILSIIWANLWFSNHLCCSDWWRTLVIKIIPLRWPILFLSALPVAFIGWLTYRKGKNQIRINRWFFRKSDFYIGIVLIVALVTIGMLELR